MSDLTFIGTSQARKRNSPYDIAVENGFVGTEQQYELYIHGLTVSQVVLYKRSATTPNSYSTDNGSTVTYTFSNGNISFAGSDAGWHTSPYSDNGDLYVIYASANSKDSYDTILPTEWSTPVILSEEAVAGDPGNNVCIVMIYNASSSSPTLPSQQTTFTFSTGDITGLDNNWVKTPASGDKVWISTAIAMSQGSSANIPASSWSTPVVWKEKGADGATISSIEYGVSDSSTTQPSSWSPTVPSVDKGKWLWIKTEYTNSVPASYSKTYIGTDGDDGNSIFVQSATKVGKTTTVVIVDDNGNTNTLTIVDGDDGQDGQDGINGLNGYVHIAWANSADGSVDFSTTVSEGKSYIGTYSDNTAADSQDYEDYSWSLIKGADGADGEDGTDGSVWYTGTVLTGTTTATGVAGALGDKYLNTSTSNVYECTTAGDSSTAIWTYVANIKGQPGTDGASWISGTTLSGQTTATGVAGALGDMYINTSTDNVYECTTAGDSSTAIWTYRMNIKGNPGTDANVIDFTASGLTYVKNLRVPATDNSGFTDITITVDLQGSYSSGTLSTKYISGISFEDADIIYSKNGTAYSSGQHSVSVVNGDIVVIRILYTQSNQFIIQLVSSSDTVEKTINPIDETEHDHDWGSVDELPVSYLDRSGNTCTPLNGDYFVARIDFEMSPVTPQAGDNPQENGWYVRYGTSEPYTYEKTTNTTVVSGKTYYDYAHKKGVPYTLSNNSWIELTVSNPNDAEKALNLLGQVLNDPSIQPSMKTLYMWVKNLMALEATIESLFSRTITLLTNGVFKSSTLTYDPDDNRFVTNGFVLDYTGDVKLGKAFLRDIKLKCSDSKSKILLQTQEHQDGLSAFNPIDTSVSARWCTSDITGLSYSSPTQVTFNSASRYIIRPIESDTGYKHKIITGSRSGGSAGMGVKFVAPYTGRYYISMENGDSIYCQCKNITTGQTYFTQAFVGYFSCTAGDTIEAVNASSFEVYFCKYENFVYMVASKTTSTYTESNITRTIQYYQEVDALELGVYPTDTLVIGTSFDSSSHLDYKVLSSSFSQLNDGEIKCENNSYLTVDGKTYSDLTTIQKTSSILTFNNGSTSVSLSYPRDTSNRAKTGWSKCSGGSIDPVGQDSALITYNIYPSEKNTCYIGNQDNKFASAYINTINSTTVNGTHVGNVNSSGTSYSVYGAVFN